MNSSVCLPKITDGARLLQPGQPRGERTDSRLPFVWHSMAMALKFPDLHRRRFDWKKWLWTATAVMGALSAALFLFRDVRSTLGANRWFGDPDKGSLVVNINTATADELESLPGIGPVMAARIVAQRPYSRIEDLERVPGVGPRQIEGLRPFVRVEGETAERE